MSFFRRRPKRALGLRRGGQASAFQRRTLGTDRSLVGHADLSEHESPLSDQFSVSRCVAHGVSGAVYTTLAARGEPLGFVPDVDLLYGLCLRVDRAIDFPLLRYRDLPALRDQGTRLATGVDVISRYGLAPAVGESIRTFDPKLRRGLAQSIAAARRVLIGAYAVGSLADSALALERARSLAIGGYWSSEIFDRKPDARPIGAQRLDDPDGGGHCVELLGYRTTRTGREWLIKNSWGTGWGQGGFAWATDAFLRQQWSVYVLDVRQREQ